MCISFDVCLFGRFTLVSDLWWCLELVGVILSVGFLLGLFLGALAQIGDLSESLIKRDCQVKDSGILVPGFGGMLDLVDSILFAAPAFYFYLTHVVIGR